IGCRQLTAFYIYFCLEFLQWEFRKLVSKMYGKIIFFFRIKNMYRFTFRNKNTFVTYLTSSFSVEGSDIQDNLEKSFAFLCYFPVFGDKNVCFGMIVPNKFRTIIFTQFYPVICCNRSGSS